MSSIELFRPMEMLQAADKPASGTERAVDGRLASLLDSLSGQVSGAFTQLNDLHRELCARQQATNERESEISRRAEQISQDRSEIEQLRASAETASAELDRQSNELRRRSDELSRTERDLTSRGEALARDRVELEQLRASLETSSNELARQSAELDRRSDELSRAERDLARREEDLAHNRIELEQLRASLDATSAVLARRAEQIADDERELSERSERMTCEERRMAELAEEMERRSALLAAREQAVDGFHALLGRMRDAMVAPTAEEVSEAAAVVETAVVETVPEPVPFEPDPSWQAVATDAGSSSEPTREPEAQIEDASDHAPTVDLSDFSEEELATFGVRRRLRAYSDEFLAAEIRAERNGKGKKKRWF